MSAARPALAVAEPAPADILSVIVAVVQDQDDLARLHHAYAAALAGTARAVEFIYVLGRDAVRAQAALAELKAAGAPLAAIVLSRWDGEAAALRAGFRHARGAVVLTLPGVCQVPAAVLPRVLEALDGCDMVTTRRSLREHAWFDRVQAAVFHRLIRILFGRTFGDLACRVRACRRQVLDEVASTSAQQHFLPLLAAERGFRIHEVDVPPGEPPPGGTRTRRGHLNPIARLRLALDALALYVGLNFTRRPLRFFGALGLPILLVGVIVTAALVISRLVFGVPLGDRPALILGVLLVVLGIQVIALGLIGEIMIFATGKRVKDYTIDKIL